MQDTRKQDFYQNKSFCPTIWEANNNKTLLYTSKNAKHTLLLRITAEFYSLPWWLFIFPKLTLLFYFYFNLFLFLFFFFALASFSPLFWHFPKRIQTQYVTPIIIFLSAFYKDVYKNWIEVQVYLSSPASQQKSEQGLRKSLAASRALKALVH